MFILFSARIYHVLMAWLAMIAEMHLPSLSSIYDAEQFGEIRTRT